MSYVDGFLLVVPKKNMAKYKKIAKVAGKVWRDHGAVEYRECVGDDLFIKGMPGFPKRVQMKKTETVLFSWIVYENKAQRNRVNASVMKDKRMLKMCEEMQKSPIFELKRMSYGGFKTIVEL